MSAAQTDFDASSQATRQIVAFYVQSQCYAVPIDSVVEMNLLHDVKPIAGAPSWIRGMMERRESLIPILDLRLRIGMIDLESEIRDISSQLAAQRQRLVAWLAELEVDCGRTSDKGRSQDIKNCGLWTWLREYETPSAMLSAEILKFEEPHTRLHTLGERCGEMSRRGEVELAKEEIAETRESEFQIALDLFDRIELDIHERERQMIVVLKGQDENLGIAVDRVDSVATFEASRIEARPLQGLSIDDEGNDLLVTHVVRSEEEHHLIQILDVDQLLSSAGVACSSAEAEASAEGSVPMAAE